MLQESEEEIILPWEASYAKETKSDYFRDSRWFLEAAGYVDAKLVHHKTGNLPKELMERQRALVDGAMLKAIASAKADPKLAKLQVLRFIRAMNVRVVNKEVGATEVRRRVTPIKKAFELNDVDFSWKRLMALLPKERRSKDREYHLDELQLIVSKASQHLRVAVLIMVSCGMRVGGFEFLNVGDVRPVYRSKEGAIVVCRERVKVPEGAALLCGTMTVYSGEGDDEYETLISKEAYCEFEDYLKTRPTREGPAILTRDFSRRSHPGTIKNSLNNLLHDLGIRKEKRKRHEFQVDHGLRKFFDNNAKDHMEEGYVKRLYGHDLGTEEHYDRRIPLRCVEQYLVAMPYLTVAPRLREELLKNQAVEKENADLKTVQHEKIRDLEHRLLMEKDERKTLDERTLKLEEYIALLKRKEQLLHDGHR